MQGCPAHPVLNCHHWLTSLIMHAADHAKEHAKENSKDKGALEDGDSNRFPGIAPISTRRSNSIRSDMSEPLLTTITSQAVLMSGGFGELGQSKTGAGMHDSAAASLGCAVQAGLSCMLEHIAGA